VRIPTRLAAFAVALAAVLGAGAGIGAAIGPDVDAAEAEAPAPEGEGVVSALEGYRMIPTSTRLAAEGGTFEFLIAAPDGDPELAFTELHERDLHLIVASQELSTFHHVHPALAADGTWSVELPALPAGSYRAIADFQVADGPRLALGTDLSVAGEYEPAAVEPPSRIADVDGYEVTLEAEPGDGGNVDVTLTVRRDGAVVELEPYLGAMGHLVALRSGDLAYAHVHAADGRFEATLPSAGRYGLFFDFKHDGTVRTAAFTFDQGIVTGGTEMGH
jgi:hypothetical protein